MKRIILYWLSIIAGYFSGSILFGYEIPKIIKKINVCELSEDGNPGTYNAFRYGGFACGVGVLAADILKGCVSVWLCAQAFGTDSYLFSLAMASPVLGHAFSAFYFIGKYFGMRNDEENPYLNGLKGGKEIAVSFGVMLGLYPDIRPLLFLVISYLFFSLIVPIRDHGRRTVTAYMCFLAASLIFIKQRYITAGIILISCIVIYKHTLKRRRQMNAGTDSILQYRRRS